MVKQFPNHASDDGGHHISPQLARKMNYTGKNGKLAFSKHQHLNKMIHCEYLLYMLYLLYISLHL